MIISHGHIHIAGIGSAGVSCLTRLVQIWFSLYFGTCFMFQWHFKARMYLYIYGSSLTKARQLGLLTIHSSCVPPFVHSRIPLELSSSYSCLSTEACPLGTLVQTKLPSGCVTWLSHLCPHSIHICHRHILLGSKSDQCPVETLHFECVERLLFFIRPSPFDTFVHKFV